MPRTIRTMCPMNCHPTLCGMLVDLDDSSRLLRVRGDPENPDSRGFLCIRGHAAREIIGNPQRVLSPLHRAEKSGTWRPIAWTDALDLISEEARAAGPAAVGTWSGHGFFANNYGTRLSSELLRRFANLYGCQWWTPTMICWGLGAFGLGLTGILEVNTKEDMGESSALILLWGANLASQPNTGRHLAAAKRRGAHVVTIDVRRTEASAQSDETLLVRPGTDAALALGLMHVVLEEGLHDAAFVARHTVGFDALRAHLTKHDAAWASGITGVAQDRIVALARRYATTRPAMILLGGSSMYKGRAGWQGSRAVSCLPALTGNLGIPGGGMGPRHAGLTHGQALASIAANDRRPPGDDVPQQMSRITDALETSRLRVLLLFGTDMVSSFADAGRLERALGKLDLLATYDLFMHDTARRHADLFLPATTWLEDTGCKSTNTHLYLMPKVLEPAGEARSPGWVLRELARRLDVRDFFPWTEETGPLDALLDHPSTGHATASSLASEGGIRALQISHVSYPDLRFDTPSGKVEFFSERAKSFGLPALPVFEPAPPSSFPLAFRFGRTLTQFHAFYDHGRALPTLAAADPEPRLWISPADASARGLSDGDGIRIFNQRGEMLARASVTDKVPPGTVWMRDGWQGQNTLTSGAPVLPDAAVDLFGRFSGGQAEFETAVEVAPEPLTPQMDVHSRG
ncbi:MAG TPA: molybdopterin-dependent oxidoreductase [Myxococcales bacterium]|nr:molybdopterin-dependent oxidoreductase [Myxococcales bacterium]